MISYLDMLPTVIPGGRVLVHNHARPTRRLDPTGFRAWSEPAPASVTSRDDFVRRKFPDLFDHLGRL